MVGFLMLHGMSALVGGHCGGGHMTAVIHILAQVQGLVGGIIMVGERSLDTDHLHIIDAVLMQHLLCNFAPCEAGRQKLFRIFANFRFQTSLHDETQNHEKAKNQPVGHFSKIKS